MSELTTIPRGTYTGAGRVSWGSYYFDFEGTLTYETAIANPAFTVFKIDGNWVNDGGFHQNGQPTYAFNSNEWILQIRATPATLESGWNFSAGASPDPITVDNSPSGEGCNCQPEIAALQSQIDNLQSNSPADMNGYLLKEEFMQLVGQYKDEIVSILMTANTWEELNIEINLADYVKVQ